MSGFIPQEVIQDIRKQTDIVDVISQYVQLSKSGVNYMGSCPFHEDRNPSFSIHTGKQIFKCFSCGRGGNVFSFLQEMEGIGFVQAVQEVAEFSGIQVNPQYFSQQSSNQKQHQDLYKIHALTSKFYHYYLTKTTNGEAALKYLQQRELQMETLEEFQIGFAPHNSEVLRQYLMKEGFSTEQLLQSGIFYLNDEELLIDRFRGRIIFPLRNLRGEVVAFSGRVFDFEHQAKYLNSPETAIFEKSNLLFNLDQARLVGRQMNQLLVVEGFMDVLSLSQAGFSNSVATMGTSLTAAHLKQLTRVAQEIMFVFDGDQAGQEATVRGFELGRQFSKTTFKMIRIPGRLDPDDWIQQQGALSFQGLIDNAETEYQFQREYLKKIHSVTTSQGLANYIEALIKIIAQLASPIEQQLLLKDLVNEYDLDEKLLEEQLAVVNFEQEQLPMEAIESFNPATAEMFVPHDQVVSDYIPEDSMVFSQAALQAERELFINLMHHGEAWEFFEQLNPAPYMFHPQSQDFYFRLQDYYYDRGKPLPLVDIVDEIDDPSLSSFITSIIWDFDVMDYEEQILIDCLQVLEREFLKQEIKLLREKLSDYEREQRYNEVNDLLVKIMQLTRKLKTNY